MSWWSRLTNVLNPRRLDESLDDEIRDHLERRAAAFAAEGLSPDEARRRAAIAFGSISRVREESREIRMFAALDGTLQDLRYAWRTMRRTPAFTATALLSLGLAIGANTAIFTVVDAAAFRPLLVPDAASLFTLTAPTLDPGGPGGIAETEAFSYPLYLQLRAAAADAAVLAALGPVDRADAQGPDDSAPIVRVTQQYASGLAFETLRLSPALGRLFSRDDDRAAGASRIAVLGFRYWRSQFHGDAAVVGRNVTLNGRSYEIVGVAPQEFFGLEPGRYVDVWLPLGQFDSAVFTNADANLFRIFGRLAHDATTVQLQARLQGIFRERQKEVAARNAALPAAALTAYESRQLQIRGGGIGVSDLQRAYARPMAIVWSVAAAMLLVACANVASLLLSRSAARTSEMRLRASLGATRGRLVRQRLTESVLLSGLATIVGVLAATAATPWLVARLSSGSDPIHLALTFDGRVLFFSSGLCALTTLVTGVLPTWYDRRGRRVALGRVFVAVQVAFVFCVVVLGSGFLFSLNRLFAVEPGFEPRNVTVISMRSDLGPKQDGLTLTRQLQRQVSELPDVQGAAVAWWAIFSGNRRAEQIAVDGRPPSDRAETFYRVSPGYFATLQIPLVEGRDLTPEDGDGAEPIPTIVDRTFARRYYGGAPVLGREFRRRADNARHVIVGVVADAYYSDLRRGPQPIVYFPMKPPRFFTLYVRSTLDPGTVRRAVEQASRAVGPGLHVGEVTTLDGLIGDTLLKEKLLAGVGGVFAALGLALVAIGLFGLLSYSVAQRTKEFGIRTALGAPRRELMRLAVGELLGMMAAGLTAGLLCSFILADLVKSQLFDIGGTDPVVMLVAGVAFLFTTSIAVVLPAYRAATLDPLVALRND